jgi:hypothetical protein
MRYKVRVSEQGLARKVQTRVRRKGVWVHNLLVRFIVKTTMDILVELPPMTRNLFFEGWLEHKHQQKPGNWRRLRRHLMRTYNERIMRERGLRYWAYLRRLRHVDLLTAAEVVALQEARRDAMRRGDAAMVAAVDKAIRSLRGSGDLSPMKKR